MQMLKKILIIISMMTLVQGCQTVQNKTNNQMEAIDRDMMRDSNAAMPMLKPERRSQVAFGGKKPDS